MSQEQDRAFFRNYSIVIGVLALMIVVFIVLARVIGIDDEAVSARDEAAMRESTAPVGQVNVAGEEQVVEDTNEVAMAEPAGMSADKGKQVYSGLCFSCHGTGLPGIPQLGDAAAWSERTAKGMDVVYSNALNGFTGTSSMMMPAKGGNPALSDDEVKAAVDYMVAGSK